MAKKEVRHVGKVQLVPRGDWWHVRYSTPMGRIARALGVTNLRVAEQKAREIDELLQAGRFAELYQREDQRQETFRSFVTDIFVPQYPRWAESTRQSCRPLINKLLRAFGDLRMTDITGDDMEMYLTRAAADEGWADASYNRILAILKSIFAYAHERGRLAHNPAAIVHGRHIQKKLPTPYSETDIYRLLAWLRVYKPWALDIARIYLETGMRRGELMQLRWVDVDLPQRLFVLPQAKNRHARVIPFTNRAERIMRRLYACRAEGTPNGEVFGSSADIRKILYDAGKDRGVDTFRPVHRLRDTFGTRAAERMALEELQEIMGHLSIEMTRRYVKVRPKRLVAAMARMNP